jgi:nucleobase:cation symporter-1, NCS1 family
MADNTISRHDKLSESSLFNADLAPIPVEKRTWNLWNLAAIWIGMAVCIPTYILASYMIKSGLSWQAALLIIGLANLIITVPMVLNGHAGVKFGIPFPVLGRAAFGIKGIHIASILRAIVACGWFGVQTWIGGLAFYAIWNALTGNEGSLGLDAGKFIGFALFWLVNLYFIWNGTDSIKWLESFAAPILILIGILLIIWGSVEAGGFAVVLEQGKQLENPTAVIIRDKEQLHVSLTPLKNVQGQYKASEFQLTVPSSSTEMKALGWQKLSEKSQLVALPDSIYDKSAVINNLQNISIQFRSQSPDGYDNSGIVSISVNPGSTYATFWGYILWLTAMVGFWATMSISIADITRYAHTQKEQVLGQFLGLPATMILYSFVGIFVTFAAIANFQDILIAQDAPWDPVSLLARFDSPAVVILSQIFMIIATLSTNIAANVIAPANAFANLIPKKIDFKRGGLITGIIGIVIAPWWLLDEISGILIFVSGLLGPVLGILLCDYFIIRKKELNLTDLYLTDGVYAYSSGFNPAAMISLFLGILLALIGYWLPAVSFLYNLSWFTGFIISFVLYYGLYKVMIPSQKAKVSD